MNDELSEAYKTIDALRDQNNWFKQELLDAMEISPDNPLRLAVVSMARIIDTAKTLKAAEKERDRLKAAATERRCDVGEESL